MSRRSYSVAWVALAIALSGCGGLSYSVDRRLLGDLAIENKLALFDAENELSIALDEQEQLGKQMHEARAALARAYDQVSEAESDGARAERKKDAAAAKVAGLAVVAGEHKITYLKTSVAWLRRRVVLQTALINVADARFELAKAKLVKKNNVRGAASIDLADFEGQVSRYLEKARDEQQDVDAAAKVVASTKGVWQTARDALSKASGGGLGSPWAEDGAVWGSP